MKVLFLFESSLPSRYHSRTISPGELRVIASLPQVSKVTAIGADGQPFYEVDGTKQSAAERKIEIMRAPHTARFPYIAPFWLYIYANGYIKNHRVDLIHAESPHLSGVAATLLGKKYRIPVITEVRASYKEIAGSRIPLLPKSVEWACFKKIRKFSFDRSTFILGNSSYHEAEIKDLGYLNTSHYNPGVRLPKGFTKTRSQTVRLGFIGRLFPDKGPLQLLTLYNYFKNSFPQSYNQTSLTIAGAGPESEKMHQYIKKMRLTETVEMKDTTDRWEFFKDIDILINPNQITLALEMVNAEAAATGTPVLTFGDDKRPVTVVHKKTGIVVKQNDLENMASQLNQLVLSPEKRALFGMQAKKLYAAHFTFSRQVSQLQEVYNRI